MFDIKILHNIRGFAAAAIMASSYNRYRHFAHETRRFPWSVIPVLFNSLNFPDRIKTFFERNRISLKSYSSHNLFINLAENVHKSKWDFILHDGFHMKCRNNQTIQKNAVRNTAEESENNGGFCVSMKSLWFARQTTDGKSSERKLLVILRR